jgi:hypothetical protein
MAFNFPNSPTYNQVFEAYSWDGEKWILAVGGVPVTNISSIITSSASVSVDENATLAHALTANEAVTWSIVGGADAARFELSGSTLRWLGNGSKDYETPNDADTNNIYVVTVRATDVGSLTTDQTISVTVVNLSDVVLDPYWYNVVLLMGFEGANGSTGSPGMLDESPAARGTATVTGGRVSTAQLKFGVSSLLLDGDDSLSYPDSADWHFGGAFTIEFSVYHTTIADVEWISQWNNAIGVASWMFGRTAAAGISFVFYDATNTLYAVETPWTPNPNVWYDIAVDRDAAGVIRIYVNGSMLVKATRPQVFLNSTVGLDIGRINHSTPRFVTGHLDEIRITNGVARYASDSGYTVATAAFPRAGAPFTPTLLTGLVGWWDASVTASLDLTGANINSVANQVGGGLAMNGAVGYGNATYSATGFNSSKPAMLVANGTSLATAAGFPMGTGNTLTVWYVGTMCNPTGSDPGDCRVLDYIAVGSTQDFDNDGSWAAYRNGSSTQTASFIRNTVAATTAATITAYPAPHRFIYTINSSGLITLYVDGVSMATATKSGNWVSGGTAQIGFRYRTGGGGGHFWSGPIAEAGIATGFSVATVVAQLDRYLTNKWSRTTWTTAFSLALPADSGGYTSSYGARSEVNASLISVSGWVVRLTLQSGPTGGCEMDALYMGHRAAFGDAYDFDGTQVRITVGGSTTITIPAGGSVVSDPVVFSLDETRNLLFSYHSTINSTYGGNTTTATGCTLHYTGITGSAASAGQTDITGYTTYGPPAHQLVSKIEVL